MEKLGRSVQDMINDGDQMKLPLKKRPYARLDFYLKPLQTPLVAPRKPTKKKKLRLITCSSRSGRLPLELVCHIIVRLPLEDLLRCKCVCKRWRDEINTQRFKNSHIHYTINNKNNSSLVLFSYKQHTLTSIHFNSPDKIRIKPCLYYSDLDSEYSPVLVGSCNGLLCFTHVHYHQRDYGTSIYSLYNPITNAYKLIPNQLAERGSRRLWIGFGYDYSSGDYKILCFFRYSTILYSLKSNSWKVISNTYEAGGSISTICMIHSNNALNWIAHNNSIKGFDLGSETFHEVPLPDDLVPHGLDLIDLRGCLHLVTSTDIWIMKEYGVKQSWTKLFHFDSTIMGKMIIMPCAYSGDGKEIIVVLRKYLERFLRLDLHSGRFRDLNISGLPVNWARSCIMVPWVGSFVSPLVL